MDWNDAYDELEKWCDRKGGKFTDGGWSTADVSGPRAMCRMGQEKVQISADQHADEFTHVKYTSHDDPIQVGGIGTRVDPSGRLSAQGDDLYIATHTNATPFYFR